MTVATGYATPDVGKGKQILHVVSYGIHPGNSFQGMQTLPTVALHLVERNRAETVVEIITAAIGSECLKGEFHHVEVTFVLCQLI